MRPVILIDNYDSFTWNLLTYLHGAVESLKIYQNNEINLEDLDSLNPKTLIISPGPGRPCDSGLTPQVVGWAVENKTPLLGICLGHQALGEFFGAKLISARHILHGKVSKVEHDNQGVFEGLPNPLEVGRYHSLALDKQSINNDLKITALSEDGEVMGIRHKSLPLEGVQFHPESILTPQGRELLVNFA